MSKQFLARAAGVCDSWLLLISRMMRLSTAWGPRGRRLRTGRGGGGGGAGGQEGWRRLQGRHRHRHRHHLLSSHLPLRPNLPFCSLVVVQDVLGRVEEAKVGEGDRGGAAAAGGAAAGVVAGLTTVVRGCHGCTAWLSAQHRLVR